MAIFAVTIRLEAQITFTPVVSSQIFTDAVGTQIVEYRTLIYIWRKKYGMHKII